MPLQISLREKEPGVLAVDPVGEINTQTYAELQKKVDAAINSSTKAVIFDLKEVSYISSLGLSVLFKVKKTLEEKGGTVLLVNPQPKVKMIFEVAKVLPDYMYASLEEADEYLDSFFEGIQKGKITPRRRPA
jgi:anti-anti-sigma factor